jgi:hypothetical protein
MINLSSAVLGMPCGDAVPDPPFARAPCRACVSKLAPACRDSFVRAPAWRADRSTRPAHLSGPCAQSARAGWLPGPPPSCCRCARRSWKCRSGMPIALRALVQVRRKFDRRSLPPCGPTKTRPSSPEPANDKRCQPSSGAISLGRATVGRPAADLGPSSISWPRWLTKTPYCQSTSMTSRWPTLAQATGLLPDYDKCRAYIADVHSAFRSGS